jgi:hypothetical protein
MFKHLSEPPTAKRGALCHASYALQSVKVTHIGEDFVKIAQPFIRFLGEAVD